MIGVYLAYYARRTPGAQAIIHDGHELDYESLVSIVARVAEGLLGLGILPRQRALIDVQDPFTQCLLMLALDWLGCEIAVAAPGSPADRAALGMLDWSLSDREATPDRATRRHRVTADWFRSMLNASRGAGTLPVCEGDHELVHIRSSSGRDGEFRLLEISKSAMRARISERAWSLALTGTSRYLVAMPFVSASVYASALACLSVGGALVFESRSLAGSGALTRTTHTTMMLLHLLDLLDSVPTTAPRDAPLTIVVLGAKVSGPLRARAQAQLGARTIENYGSNECGTLASRIDEGPLLINPEIDMRIVDDHGQPMAVGESGHIVVRTGGAVIGPAASNPNGEQSSDAWFRTGDVGIMHTPTQLEVLGRSDEIINLGGQKVVPGELEGRLQRALGRGDIGVARGVDTDGVARLCVAVAGLDGSATTLGALAQQIGELLGPALGNIVLVVVPKMPRDLDGQIQRRELRALIESELKQSRKPQGHSP